MNSQFYWNRLILSFVWGFSMLWNALGLPSLQPPQPGMPAGADGKTALQLFLPGVMNQPGVPEEPPPTQTPPPPPGSTATPDPTTTPIPPTTEPTPPVLVAVGDIADCASSGDEATAKLVKDGAAVAVLGDAVYEEGTAQQFNDCYDPSWGKFKERTRPAAGNHEYLTPGAKGYFDYFGPAAGEPGKGYYSYDLGSWHLIVLNSECDQVGGCGPDSPQEKWLRADLAANAKECTLAYWHAPLFTSGKRGENNEVITFWEDLYAAGVDVILNSHDHFYERFAPQDPEGNLDGDHGIRQFIVGTGGKSHHEVAAIAGNSRVRIEGVYGVLQMTLKDDSYDWKFLPVAGETASDNGSGECR